MNSLYILQIMSSTVDLPNLDLHNLVNTGGIAFLIWYAQRFIKRQDTTDSHIQDIIIRLTKIETKDEVRKENK